MSKQYTLPEDDGAKMASEPVAAYALPQNHRSAYFDVTPNGAVNADEMKIRFDGNVKDVSTSEEPSSFAKKVCFSDESYRYHEQHEFYQTEIPEQENFDTEEQLVASLDAADVEGYVADEETNHIMNLWKLVD